MDLKSFIGSADATILTARRPRESGASEDAEDVTAALQGERYEGNTIHVVAGLPPCAQNEQVILGFFDHASMLSNPTAPHFADCAVVSAVER